MDEILQHVLQPLAMAIYMNDHVDVYNKSKGLLPTALLCCPLALHYLPNVLDFSCTVEPLFLLTIFPGLFSADHFSPLQSHHSFTIRYSLGEDTGTRPILHPQKHLIRLADLSTHRDDSDVTLNVCMHVTLITPHWHSVGCRYASAKNLPVAPCSFATQATPESTSMTLVKCPRNSIFSTK